MRINFLACILFHIYLGSVLAQDENSLSGVKGLPGCAMICLFSNVSHSTCQLTDLKCSCSNVPLRKILEKCVLQTCTVKESLTTKKITAKLCEVPVRERSTRLRDLNIGLAVLSHLSVFSRMGSKLAGYKAAYSFGLDDVCLLVTTYIGLGNAIIINHGAIPSGLGRDIWTLSMAAITNFIHWFYFMEILYFVQLAILKVGILFFYKRIFPGKEVKRLIWGTIAFNIAFGVAFALAGIFQCQPVSRYWTHWDGVARGGKCVDINALAWTNASISIVVDIWMLGIPLFQVAKLQMAVKEKIAVSLMFAVGFFVTIVSILRLRAIISSTDSKNPTWDQWDVTHLSVIELNVGSVCACMPTFRILLVGVLPKLFGSISGSSRQHHPGNRLQSPPGYTKSRSTVRLRVNQSVSGSLASYTVSCDSKRKVQDEDFELFSV